MLGAAADAGKLFGHDRDGWCATRVEASEAPRRVSYDLNSHCVYQDVYKRWLESRVMIVIFL